LVPDLSLSALLGEVDFEADRVDDARLAVPEVAQGAHDAEPAGSDIIAAGSLGSGFGWGPRTGGRCAVGSAHSPGRLLMLIASGLAVSA